MALKATDLRADEIKRANALKAGIEANPKRGVMEKARKAGIVRASDRKYNVR